MSQVRYNFKGMGTPARIARRKQEKRAKLVAQIVVTVLFVTFIAAIMLAMVEAN